jgi:hypothetical protein
MSTTGAVSAVPNAVPFRPGHDPRRLAGPRISPEEREYRAALESKMFPKALALVEKLYAAAEAAFAEGDIIAGTKATETFLKVCGLVQKPAGDAAAIQEAARAMMVELIAEARARRDAGSAGR